MPCTSPTARRPRRTAKPSHRDSEYSNTGLSLQKTASPWSTTTHLPHLDDPPAAFRVGGPPKPSCLEGAERGDPLLQSRFWSGTGPVAQPVFKTGPAWQPHACSVRLRGRSVPETALGLDVEAEHHPALMVFGDVAVGHPPARVRHVEQDVDRLAGAHEHRVLPDE